MSELAKVKWQCRRGMKELDLLLENYLATDYLTADTAEKTRFAQLLCLEDDELLVVLLNGDWRVKP
ncbi:MAG: succinate dehydrogenase assembly factor 2 [Methylococcales bacterium]|nr:succinate dehydrogenase assembly factor 2 [Methylococcales bacterium]MDP3839749.1 succinate dehydrogenase assembly factor 2 [Methylococcales bacterium]